jgi:general stress protein 26
MNDDRLRHATASEMEKIRELIADIEVTMLTTITPQGDVHSRPMGTVLDADRASVWLFASANSDAAAEISQEPRVGLIYADPERDRYVSVSGIAELLHERDEIRRRWRTAFAKWFPGGPDDPALVLIHVRITEVEFWDDSAKLMRNFFETIGAPFSGVPPEAVGQHARVWPE